MVYYIIHPRHHLPSQQASAVQGHSDADAGNTASCPPHASSSNSASPGVWCSGARGVGGHQAGSPTGGTTATDSQDAHSDRDGGASAGGGHARLPAPQDALSMLQTPGTLADAAAAPCVVGSQRLPYVSALWWF